jgi:hypothetical protein
MTSASIDSALQALSLLLGLALAVRLVQIRLFRVYPFFFTFLLIASLLQTSVVVFGTRSVVYFYSYVVLQPIRNVVYALVVWELFSVIFRNYAGLRSLSRWVMGVAAVIAPVGFLLTALSSGLAAARGSAYVRAVVRFELGMTFGLVIFIVIMLYFISRYPIKLPRNNVAHCLLYSVWFLGDSAILLATSFLPMDFGRRFVNDGQSLFEIGCYLAWILLLSETGEYQETRVRRDISPEHERALIGELNAMNELLLRAGRSISRTR